MKVSGTWEMAGFIVLLSLKNCNESEIIKSAFLHSLHGVFTVCHSYNERRREGSISVTVHQDSQVALCVRDRGRLWHHFCCDSSVSSV